MRTRKSPLRVSTPPTLSLGIMVLGTVAVMASVGALLRYYTRSHAVAPSAEAGVEIAAPDLEVEPSAPASATKP